MPRVDDAGRFTPPVAPEHNHTVEHLRTADLSVATYSVPAAGDDVQTPHTEDEVYVVTAGRATFVDSAGAVPVGPGDTLFVAAGVAHRFVDITEDLALVVVFAPPYRTRRPAG
jgi:mannose-6-phosphate isomerase-like protein (cupin superfamily)